MIPQFANKWVRFSK